ncbi:MAG: V4R domain-containing protein [Myxococcota bacterium]
MPLKAVRVPEPFAPPFEAAERYVEKLFTEFVRQPSEGTVHVGGDRYVMMRCESLYLAWFDAMAESFGEDAAREFIYNTAREIGRSDAQGFAERMGVTDALAKLSAGPVHFAHAGWAFVDILPDSAPATDESYYLHYYHPNTFESEVLGKQGRAVEHCACLFSAGYSAGWCSSAFNLEVHGREVACTARGDSHCEFVMAPADKLDAAQQRAQG